MEYPRKSNNLDKLLKLFSMFLSKKTSLITQLYNILKTSEPINKLTTRITTSIIILFKSMKQFQALYFLCIDKYF